MKKIEAVRLYQALSGAKFDKVESKDDRFKFYDMVLSLSKQFDEYLAAEQKASETITDEKERNEYMQKMAISETAVELPKVSKTSIYELLDSNKESMTLGALPLLMLVVSE